jgi:hypothetical protein
VNQLGSEGNFLLQTGTLSPINGDVVPLPPGGTFAAMTDAFGPGSHALYQDFVVPTGNAILSFSMFIGNRANAFFVPASLDFSTPALNQQARVDILKAATIRSALLLPTCFSTSIRPTPEIPWFPVTTPSTSI